MQDKLQALTEKLYNEGVVKASEKADAMIKEAKEMADIIEKEAHEKANQILKEAEAKAEAMRRHVESELKMSVGQAVAAFKQNLATLITMKAVQPGVKEVFSDPRFVRSIIEKAVRGWLEKESLDLQVVLPEKERSEMEQHFRNQMGELLNKGLTISFSEGVKSGFKIGPADGSYLISFTENDFINFFRSYLRPRSAELLFEDNK